MSAYLSEGIRAMIDQKRQRTVHPRARRKRKAGTAESTSPGDADWHWTDLRTAMVPAVVAVMPRLQLPTTTWSGLPVRAPSALRWQAWNRIK